MKTNRAGWKMLVAGMAIVVMGPSVVVRAEEPLGENNGLVEGGMPLADAAIADAILAQAMAQMDAIAAAIQFIAGPSSPLVTAPIGSIPNTAALISNPGLITGIASVASNLIAPPPVPPEPPQFAPAPVPVGYVGPVGPPPAPTIGSEPPLFPPGPSSPGPGELPFDPNPPAPPAPPVE